jgi:fructose transport system permease protein
MATETPARETEFEVHHRDSLGLRIQHVLHGNPVLGPLAVLVIAIIAFSIINVRFFSAANLSLVLAQVTVIATLALGQTLIILTAGIDLSTGAIAVFSSILMATFATKLGMPGIIALILGLVCGTAMGAVNAFLVTRVKLPPFIVTLGTLTIFFSLNAVVSNSETVRGSDMPDLMTWTGNTFPIGSFRFTYGSIIMLLLFGYFFYALRSTAWGKHVYATGDDIEAWILIGRLASASPNVGIDYNLDSITAVVLGGTSLFGGRGGVLGTLIGALIVGVFRNGLQLGGVEVVWQGFAIGLLVLVAVSIDQWIRKVKT